MKVVHENSLEEDYGPWTYHSDRNFTTALNQDILLFGIDLVVGQYFVTAVIRDIEFGAEVYGNFIRKEILRIKEKNEMSAERWFDSIQAFDHPSARRRIASWYNISSNVVCIVQYILGLTLCGAG